MSDFNRVILIGRVGNDLELKTSAQGKPYVRISLATNTWRSEGEKTTHWHRVVAFGTQAETCARFLRKGSPIMVEGSLEVRTYENNEGQKVTNVSVIAHSVQFLGGRMNAEVSPEGCVAEAEKDASASMVA